MAVHRGATVWVYYTWVDKDDEALTGISTHDITLLDPAGTDQEIDPSVTEDGGGEYHFKTTIPSDGIVGEWPVKWQVTLAGGEIGIEETYIEVEE